MTEFELKQDHLKVLKSLADAVYWQDIGTGAPAIEPKKPYGNSSVYPCIAEILGIEPEGEEGFSSDQENEMYEIYTGTEEALGIVLSSLDKIIQPGRYSTGSKGDEDFFVTADHIKVLKSLSNAVRWCDVEFGAPEIDPKRPYGFSGSVHPDVAKALGIEADEHGFSDRDINRMDKVYRETEQTLKAVLVNLPPMKLGTYVYDEGYWRITKVNREETAASVREKLRGLNQA